jgi:beta-lactamase regulating signal transducer with metallopeptidase domain
MWVYTLFPKVFNMSLTAGIVIIFVLLARIPLRKAPKIYSYALWAVVLFRLVCPVSFSSAFSLMGLLHAPVEENGTITFIPADIVHTEYPQVDLPIPGLNEVINQSLPQGAEQTVADPLEWPMAAVTMLWLCGVAVMLVYSTVSLLQLRRKLVGAVCLHKAIHSAAVCDGVNNCDNKGVSCRIGDFVKDSTGNGSRGNGCDGVKNVYLADHISTPFVIGLIHPKIYLPSTLTVNEMSYVILHERTHIRRLDHIVKMIAFLALAVHWFNPLVWVAFLALVKDMEMSCDEHVLKQMGHDIKADYSTSLLSLAAGRRLINGSPLAFGEGNIKGRIKNVLNFKKPAAWVTVVSVVLVAAFTIGFAANRTDDGAANGLTGETGHRNMTADTQSGTGEKAQSSTDTMSESQEGMQPAAIDSTQAEEPAETVDETQPGSDAENAARIVLSSPKLSPTQDVGADMAELDYASDDFVIFHGYFGLFVYDLKSGRIVRSLDLKPIGCSATQGDDYCDVTVSADGETVQLHPMSSKNMYVYSVVDNSLKRTAYRQMENRFSVFIDMVDVVGLEKMGAYSHKAVKFDTGEYGYLRTSDWTLDTLVYVRGDEVYKLFNFDASSDDTSLLPANDMEQSITNDIEQSISNAILNYYAVDKSGLWYETVGEGHITFET